MAPALAVATGVVVGNCKGRKVYLNKLFEKIEPVLLFRLDPVFRLNLKFSIAAYSGLWETSALLAVVHNYPQGSAWPNTGCSDRDLYVQTF
ncbi:hypothetical protein [Turicimonas muris]|uniref:hypothetical protein n=1 Tax=Turicimonas muris TaxID=1796652 RepID=UPI0026DF6A23|nr:hypothetical protein [Turicimonas muris]